MKEKKAKENKKRKLRKKAMKKKKKEQANKVSLGLPRAEGETSSSEEPSSFLETGVRSKRVMFNRLGACKKGSPSPYILFPISWFHTRVY